MEKKYPKKLFVIGLIILLACGGFVWYKMGGLDRVSIPEQFAQEQISKKLPIEKEFEVMFIDTLLTINTVSVDFQSDNRLAVIAKGNVSTFKGDADFEVYTIGQPVYANQAFYFKPDNVEIRKFKFSQKAEGTFSKAGKVAKNVANKYLGDIVKDTGIQFKAEEFTAKLKKGAEEKVKGKLIAYLHENPIKKLEGVKGTIVSLAVERTEVKNDVLTIHFSLLKFTGAIIGLIFATIAAIGILLSFPYWGPAILALGMFDFGS